MREYRFPGLEGKVAVVTDVLDDEGEALARAIRESGCHAVYKHLDVSDEAQWQGVVSEAAAELGRLDVLVNNAGIYITKVIHRLYAG